MRATEGSERGATEGSGRAFSERGGCWSITINNPTAEDEKQLASLKDQPWFKSFKSQLEQGTEGTKHIQGCLRTTQQRFSTIKKALPRAHIEVARNALALTKYVEKSDTRLEKRGDVVRDIPTLFEYQTIVAAELTVEMVHTRQMEYLEDKIFKDSGDIALEVVDEAVAKHIRNGMRGVEYIAINPMWRSSWKKFWRSIIERNGLQNICEGEGRQVPSKESYGSEDEDQESQAFQTYGECCEGDCEPD